MQRDVVRAWEGAAADETTFVESYWTRVWRERRGTGPAPGRVERTDDLYLSWGVFEHFEEGLAPCVVEAFRVLRRGGLLLLTVPFDNARCRALRRWRRSVDADPALRFYQWRLTRDELRQELVDGGFEVLELRPIHKRHGIQRSLQHELRLPPGHVVTRALAAALSPLLPAAVFAHMLFAAARRPEGASPPG